MESPAPTFLGALAPMSPSIPIRRPAHPMSAAGMRGRVRRLERRNEDLLVAVCVLLALIVPGALFLLAAWAVWRLAVRLVGAVLDRRAAERIRRRQEERAVRKAVTS